MKEREGRGGGGGGGGLGQVRNFLLLCVGPHIPLLMLFRFEGKKTFSGGRRGVESWPVGGGGGTGL